MADLPPPPDDALREAGLPLPQARRRKPGDFTIGFDTVALLPLAAVVGAAAGAFALALIDLIGFVTHLAYYGDVGTSLVDDRGNHLGWVAILVPVAGGLVVGVMARYGSDRIRGHGIPETMEVVLTGGSRMRPRLAVLKPLASAIAIGTGGPFGAEGPIIVTGGAVGSIVAQLFELSAAQRRTLLVGGACAGMCAVFGTPVAAVLFGVELLVFELRPRSLVPIATAVTFAAIVRDALAAHGLLHAEPLFTTTATGAPSAATVGEAAVVGVLAGVVAVVITYLVYGCEDAFKLLPVHWMWWPAVGGLLIGVGGLVDGRALGVGYDSIRAALTGHLTLDALLVLLVVKVAVWAIGLGSGTSGGVVAPLLLIGATMGGAAGHLFGGPDGLWALIGMASTMAGTMGAPLTSVVFALELTHNLEVLLPVLAASMVAHLFSTIALRRSILTEKVARRGFQVSREYSVDVLEAAFVRELMLTDVLTAEAGETVTALLEAVEADPLARRQRLYPVLDGSGAMVGVVGLSQLRVDGAGGPATVGGVMHTAVVSASPGETLRTLADRMAEEVVGAMPVVDDDGRLVGVITQWELLEVRRRNLVEERQRERVLRLRRARPATAPAPAPTGADLGAERR